MQLTIVGSEILPPISLFPHAKKQQQQVAMQQNFQSPNNPHMSLTTKHFNPHYSHAATQQENISESPYQFS
jgi:hypothetical protein